MPLNLSTGPSIYRWRATAAAEGQSLSTRERVALVMGERKAQVRCLLSVLRHPPQTGNCLDMELESSNARLPSFQVCAAYELAPLSVPTPSCRQRNRLDFSYEPGKRSCWK